ncbi:phosphodiester glycosidase family protein [uncultured Pedobacter sp.]|uniref:phosphodiester glycosidase family protein n=1 Tax=uncultured Pedobacter sp. TaxID=246139 RepID=UPI0026251AF1|nr:phosphodiester glycosidase family protein [uncultured Pedobacter sp.]
MRIRYNLWLLLYLIAFASCKKSTVTQTKSKEEIVAVTPQEESLDVKLTKKTTLIERVVFFNETELVKGVKEAKLSYIDKNLQPMVLFFFKVDLNEKQLVLKPLTPNGDKKYAMQSIPDMIKTNQFSGLKVVGAVNADFFNTSTGEPRSIVYLKGEAVRTILPEIRSYFGINQNGKPFIGDHSVFSQQRSTIFDALGGYHRLIKQSLPVKQTDVSIHPRTAVGFTANNMVYFLVADGRNANYSNGLTLAQVAEIMAALEVKEAINLDGGGSSTFVINTSQIEVKNKPSDGSPRKVANGWAICIKN